VYPLLGVDLNSLVIQYPLRDSVLVGKVLDCLNGIRESVVPFSPGFLIAYRPTRKWVAVPCPVVPKEDGGGALLPLTGRSDGRYVGFANSVC